MADIGSYKNKINKIKRQIDGLQKKLIFYEDKLKERIEKDKITNKNYRERVKQDNTSVKED